MIKMGRRRTIRIYSNIENNNLNGSLFICKRGCDLKHPFNSLKRQQCKEKCESDNIEEANQLYPQGNPYNEVNIPPNTNQNYSNQNNNNGNGLGNNKILLLGAAAIFLMKMNKDKTKKRR